MNHKVLIFGSIIFFIGCGGMAAHSEALKKKARSPNAGRSLSFADPTGWPIIDKSQRQVGIVSTRRDRRGVTVNLDLRGLPPGVHAVHIHQYPRCDAPTFESAGAHWNWMGKQHGHRNPRGHHAGDLGNVTVGKSGNVQTRFLVPWKDWDPKLSRGLALVIHASADDERTDPSGNSGGRIACGMMYLRKAS